MKIIFKGNEEEIQRDHLTILDFLFQKDVDRPEMVSVQVNNQFIDPKEYADYFLEDGDKVEFLFFMGGGC